MEVNDDTYKHLRNPTHSARKQILQRPRRPGAMIRFLNRLRHSGEFLSELSRPLEFLSNSHNLLD